MEPIDDRRRRHLTALAALLCAVPVALAPLAARSSLDANRDRAAFGERFVKPLPPLQWKARAVRVSRDPFLADADAAAKPAAIAAHMPVVQTAFVEAVATGGTPRALVQDGAQARIVGIGDALAGSRVTAIDAEMVRLANGTVLHLVQAVP